MQGKTPQYFTDKVSKGVSSSLLRSQFDFWGNIMAENFHLETADDFLKNKNFDPTKQRNHYQDRYRVYNKA